jgi:hypothetical protein
MPILKSLYRKVDEYREHVWNKLDDRGIKSYLNDIDIRTIIIIPRHVFRPDPTKEFFTTPFHEAVKYSNNTLLATRILLNEGIDPNSKDFYGLTVLQTAVLNERCCIDTIRLLLQHGARVDGKKRVYGCNPWYLSVMFTSRPLPEQNFLLKLFIQYTVVIRCTQKTTSEILNVKNILERRPESIAVLNSCIREWHTLRDSSKSLFYSFCTGEKIILNEKNIFALLDVDKRCPHFQEISTIMIHHLFLFAQPRNVFENLNLDCFLRVLYKENREDVSNFLCTFCE